MTKRPWRWTPKRSKCAIMRALGHTFPEIVEETGVGLRTVKTWSKKTEFANEVDRLSLMVGIAARAERLRIAQRVVRQRVKKGHVQTNYDLLAWLKFAQSETDGVKLDLAALAENALALADGGPVGDAAEAAGEKPDADAVAD